MTNDHAFTLRLPADLAKRVDRLVAAHKRDPSLAGVRVSRQFVLRRALAVGVEELGGASVRRSKRAQKGR